MSASLDAVAQEALVLPPEQRVALAYRLLESVEPGAEFGADTAWEKEIAERIARYDRGEVETVSAETVFASLRKIAPGR